MREHTAVEPVVRGITCACTFLVVASCTNVTNECTTEKCYKREKKAQCALRRQWIKTVGSRHTV